MKNNSILIPIFAFLFGIGLVACTQTPTQPTQIVLPTSSTTIPETVTFVYGPTPSPWPTMPFDFIPDTVYVEQWQAYEQALAGKLIAHVPIENARCEWEILGESDLEVYVWAACRGKFNAGDEELVAGGYIPAVIHLDENGSIQLVEIPKGGNLYASSIRDMFPDDIAKRISDKLIDFKRLMEHLDWRLEHPEEPPLLVLDATPSP